MAKYLGEAKVFIWMGLVKEGGALSTGGFVIGVFPYCQASVMSAAQKKVFHMRLILFDCSKPN